MRVMCARERMREFGRVCAVREQSGGAGKLERFVGKKSCEVVQEWYKICKVATITPNRTHIWGTIEGAFFGMIEIRAEVDFLAKSKYEKRYAEELVEYFTRFLELRDDPKEDDKAERQGMVVVDMANPGGAVVTRKPSAGYPSLVKFAIKLGVTPQTLNNWRKHKEFAEAMEFADMIQDEVLNERALSGTVDGRVAMKIRELKVNSRRMLENESGGASLQLSLKDEEDGKRIKIDQWKGDLNEDTDY